MTSRIARPQGGAEAGRERVIDSCACLWPQSEGRKGWSVPEAEREKAEVRAGACETHRRERRCGR